MDVDQRVNRNSRVRSDLDKGVEGKGESVVEFVCQILEQTRVIDCHVQREVGRVDEVRVLANGATIFVLDSEIGDPLCLPQPGSG